MCTVYKKYILFTQFCWVCTVYIQEIYTVYTILLNVHGVYTRNIYCLHNFAECARCTRKYTVPVSILTVRLLVLLMYYRRNISSYGFPGYKDFWGLEEYVYTVYASTREAVSLPLWQRAWPPVAIYIYSTSPLTPALPPPVKMCPVNSAMDLVYRNSTTLQLFDGVRPGFLNGYVYVLSIAEFSMVP